MMRNASRSGAPTPTSTITPAASSVRRSARPAHRADRFAAVGLVEVAGRRLIDDPTDLEPAHLAGDHAVFDRRASAPAASITSRDREVRGRGGGRCRQRLRDRGEQRAFDRVPDRRSGTRSARRGGRAGRCACSAMRSSDVGAVPDRPRQRLPERSFGVTVDQHPRPLVDDERGAVGEPARLRDDRRPEVVGHERAQLDRQELAAPRTNRVAHPATLPSCSIADSPSWLVQRRTPPVRSHGANERRSSGRSWRERSSSAGVAGAFLRGP